MFMNVSSESFVELTTSSLVSSVTLGLVLQPYYLILLLVMRIVRHPHDSSLLTSALATITQIVHENSASIDKPQSNEH